MQGRRLSRDRLEDCKVEGCHGIGLELARYKVVTGYAWRCKVEGCHGIGLEIARSKVVTG